MSVALNAVQDEFPEETMAAETTAVGSGEEVSLLLTRRQTSRLLSISEWAVDTAIAAGLLKARRMGKKVLIPRSEAEQFASRLPLAT